MLAQSVHVNAGLLLPVTTATFCVSCEHNQCTAWAAYNVAVTLSGWPQGGLWFFLSCTFEAGNHSCALHAPTSGCCRWFSGSARYLCCVPLNGCCSCPALHAAFNCTGHMAIACMRVPTCQYDQVRALVSACGCAAMLGGSKSCFWVISLGQKGCIAELSWVPGTCRWGLASGDLQASSCCTVWSCALPAAC